MFTHLYNVYAWVHVAWAPGNTPYTFPDKLSKRIFKIASRCQLLNSLRAICDHEQRYVLWHWLNLITVATLTEAISRGLIVSEFQTHTKTAYPTILVDRYQDRRQRPPPLPPQNPPPTSTAKHVLAGRQKINPSTGTGTRAENKANTNNKILSAQCNRWSEFLESASCGEGVSTQVHIRRYLSFVVGWRTYTQVNFTWRKI